MKVNKNQKLALLVVAAIISLMLAFPPFHIVLAGGETINRGYSFILDPPGPKKAGLNRSDVDVGTLIAQWIGVLLVGGLTFVALKDND